jgi:hypothetical protein
MTKGLIETCFSSFNELKTNQNDSCQKRMLPHGHLNLAPYVALVITKIFFEINKHQPLRFENKY